MFDYCVYVWYDDDGSCFRVGYGSERSAYINFKGYHASDFRVVVIQDRLTQNGAKFAYQILSTALNPTIRVDNFKEIPREPYDES